MAASRSFDGSGADSRLVHTVLDTLKSLAHHDAAGVPRTKILQQLQRGKDEAANSVSLRLAASALLSWSERLLLAQADRRPAPSAAFWRLGTRLTRNGFILQALGSLLITLVMAIISATPAVAFLGIPLLLGAALRRLHDLGRGLPTLLVLGCLTPVLPFLPLVLFALPGDKLPNRYGVPPGSECKDSLTGGLQATLRRLDS